MVPIGFCNLALVGGGWGGVARGSSHHGALCGGGQDAAAVLGAVLCAERCGCVFIGFSGVELIGGGVPLWGGDSWHLGLGACVQYSCPGWEWPFGELHAHSGFSLGWCPSPPWKEGDHLLGLVAHLGYQYQDLVV
ncbi:hypothetical protein AMECASPLE_032455 [Ameca splendens]|uniref:Uncharacterized protein n=1 Tax=Ameca splendens TaxID=208324 RepID=A0ABV0ZS34_9TELE